METKIVLIDFVLANCHKNPIMKKDVHGTYCNFFERYLITTNNRKEMVWNFMMQPYPFIKEW
jgi:hypothetical protein